ncbi:hypothetical protein EDD85DRAFT_459080 [Armillaria nabsnona]|nr:hypothetical protein EDD85DRAFT_459080 [Armillaria nabsnona]
MESISGLAAPSHVKQDTSDEDHVSASFVVVEREVTTVAGSPKSVLASATVIERVISRPAASNRDDPSSSQTSPSSSVGTNDSDVSSNIPHIIVSGASPTAAEPSLPTHILCDAHVLPNSPTSEATARAAAGQIAESGKSIGIPQSGIPESTYDWSNAEKEFEETLPSSIGHYVRKTLIDEFTPAKFTVPAMQTDFNTYRCISPQTGEEEVLPVGWTKHTHSDGKPYFYHDRDKVITEEWLYERDIAEKVARYISILKDAISKRSQSFDRLKFWHIYVEIAQYERPGRCGGNRQFRCRYYFVNHDAECIFWLFECRLDIYLRELRGGMSPDLIRRYLQKEYW